MGEIRSCSMDHVRRYGEIYAKAFSREPWNDPWEPEDAVIHVKEILEMKQSYFLPDHFDSDPPGRKHW